MDDCYVYRPITSSDDHKALDQDLKNVHSWYKDWQMSFTIAKCKLLSVTNEQKPRIHTYNYAGETTATSLQSEDC